MLGLLDTACQAFRDALTLCPDDLKPYMALVESLMEKNSYSVQEWEVLLAEIEHKELLLKEANVVLPSEIYRSLYQILHHLRRYSEAWSFIEKANQIDLAIKSSRGHR